jgi:hypothetical protein
MFLQLAGVKTYQHLGFLSFEVGQDNYFCASKMIY